MFPAKMCRAWDFLWAVNEEEKWLKVGLESDCRHHQPAPSWIAMDCNCHQQQHFGPRLGMPLIWGDPLMSWWQSWSPTLPLSSTWSQARTRGHHHHQPRHRPWVCYSDNLPSAQGKSNTATNHLLQKSLQEIKGNPLNNEYKMCKSLNICLLTWNLPCPALSFL